MQLFLRKSLGALPEDSVDFALGNIFKDSPQCRILVSKEFHKVSLNIQIYINVFKIF